MRKKGEIPWLRPDAKTQVSIEYHGHKPERASAIVVSTQHAADVKQKEIRETLLELLIKKVIPGEWLDKKTTYLINPTGRFVVGGPEGDAGITGRKIIVDSYGGMGRHGGGAFSGKDPSKVDRSAAYMGRWVAKNVVASGLADRCEVQFAYAIGHPEPVSVSIDTFTKSWNARFVKSSISNRLRLSNSSTYCAQSIGKLLTTDTSVELMISMPLLGNGRIGRRHCGRQHDNS